MVTYVDRKQGEHGNHRIRQDKSQGTKVGQSQIDDYQIVMYS